jgi:hypothetical protein
MVFPVDPLPFHSFRFLIFKRLKSICERAGIIPPNSFETLECCFSLTIHRIFQYYFQPRPKCRAFLCASCGTPTSTKAPLACQTKSKTSKGLEKSHNLASGRPSVAFGRLPRLVTAHQGLGRLPDNERMVGVCQAGVYSCRPLLERGVLNGRCGRLCPLLSPTIRVRCTHR